MKAEYREVIYYKGYEYHFNEKGFIKKSEVPSGEQTTEPIEPNEMLKIFDDGETQLSKKILIETKMDPKEKHEKK